MITSVVVGGYPINPAKHEEGFCEIYRFTGIPCECRNHLSVLVEVKSSRSNGRSGIIQAQRCERCGTQAELLLYFPTIEDNLQNKRPHVCSIFFQSLLGRFE